MSGRLTDSTIHDSVADITFKFT